MFLCVCDAFIYGICIYSTEVIMHTIKKPYLVYFDFGVFEKDLIHIEMLHRECWLV